MLATGSYSEATMLAIRLVAYCVQINFNLFLIAAEMRDNLFGVFGH